MNEIFTKNYDGLILCEFPIHNSSIISILCRDRVEIMSKRQLRFRLNLKATFLI